jgi:hypothetical protein
MPHLDGVNDGIDYGVKNEKTTAVTIGNHEPGVIGTSQTGVGVFGTGGDNSSFGLFGNAGTGVQGVCADGPGVSGLSSAGPGVVGESKTGIGVHGSGGQLAGQFDGKVQVNGNASISGVLNVPSIANTASPAVSIKGSMTCQSMLPN